MNTNSSLTAAYALIIASGAAMAVPLPLRDQFSKALAEVYARAYTIDEMQALVAFFQSELGRTYVRKQQTMVDEMGSVFSKIKSVSLRGDDQERVAAFRHRAGTESPNLATARRNPARWRILADTRSGRQARLRAAIACAGRLHIVESVTPFEHEFTGGTHTVLLALEDADEAIRAERWTDMHGEFRESGSAAGGHTAKFTYHSGAQTSSSGSF